MNSRHQEPSPWLSAVRAGFVVLLTTPLAIMAGCHKNAPLKSEAAQKQPASLGVKVRKIQAGGECMVDLGTDPSLRGMVVTLNGRPVEVPVDATKGLPHWDASGSVEIAESDGDVMLMLSGSTQSPEGWLCSFRIRNFCVLTRELRLGSADPVVNHFLPAPRPITLTPAERDKIRQEKSDPHANQPSKNP